MADVKDHILVQSQCALQMLVESHYGLHMLAVSSSFSCFFHLPGITGGSSAGVADS